MRALRGTDKDGPLRTVQSPAADALIESVYRARCHLVPFGRSGDRGSEHPALRGLVYASGGRRAGHCRCNRTGTVIAPVSRATQLIDRTFCDGQHTLRGHPIRNAEARHVDGRPEC
jgi:hypothetical protein